VSPSDHYVEGEPEFMGHVLDVVGFVCRHPEQLVLLGAIPDNADTEYGWIEPGEAVGRLRSATVCRVRRFWEKPAPELTSRSSRPLEFPGPGHWSGSGTLSCRAHRVPDRPSAHRPCLFWSAREHGTGSSEVVVTRSIRGLRT
jgi:mannose-1-phosphate guanylyltransferase